jgi:hypothetical protein
MKSTKTVIITAITLLAASVAYSWGPEGHKTVAELARGLLTDGTRIEINKLLNNDDLAAVATWSDEVRAAARGKGPLVNDPEAAQFNKSFPHNDQWHFVNLPLGSSQYTDNGIFSTTNDVVHEINNSIAVLEGKSDQMTKVQALRVLVHLVGDIHQPLHVGTGYFQTDELDSPKLITDPTEAAGKPDDVGGNDLFYGPGAFDELHGFWDGNLVEGVAHTANFMTLAAKLTNQIDKVNWATAGDFHQWAEAWATDSVKQALEAYQGIKFGQAQFNAHHQLRRISITLPQTYSEDQTTRVSTQLTKAGFHLGDLLNHIKWSAQDVASDRNHN